MPPSVGQLDLATATAAAVLGGSEGATTIPQPKRGVPAVQPASGLMPALPSTTALGHPLPFSVAAIVPTQLPAALEHSVTQALSDLTNMRAQYPQQCAEAELAGSGMHKEAARCGPPAEGGLYYPTLVLALGCKLLEGRRALPTCYPIATASVVQASERVPGGLLRL